MARIAGFEKRNRPEHQEITGNRMLSRYPSQERPSGSRSENKDQCKNQKGSEAYCCQQEKIGIEH